MIAIGIVDDDYLVRQVLAKMFEPASDIEVVWTAPDGVEALACLANPKYKPVDVMLVDVQMPNMGGLELTKNIREQYPSIAILILTSLVVDDILHEALALGVRGFVAKEDSTNAMVGAIKQAAAGNLIISETGSKILAQQLITGVPRLPDGSKQTPKQRAQERFRLTSREHEVLTLLVSALSNKQIATELGIGLPTVKTHMQNLYKKLDCQDRVGAAMIAMHNELV